METILTGYGSDKRFKCLKKQKKNFKAEQQVHMEVNPIQFRKTKDVTLKVLL